MRYETRSICSIASRSPSSRRRSSSSSIIRATVPRRGLARRSARSRRRARTTSRAGRGTPLAARGADRRRRGRARRSPRARRGSGRPRRRHIAARRRPLGIDPPGTNTSPRRASITGIALLRAGREGVECRHARPFDPEREPESTGDGEADVGAREAAGPGADHERVEPGRAHDAWRISASTSSSSVRATDDRAPRTSPSSTSALVATSVAVSKARISTRNFF